MRSCFIPYTGFHVRCCPETPPSSLAQSGVDTAPAETTTPTGRVRAFVPRSLILTVLIPGSNRVWSWKVHLLSQRPEIVVMVRCRWSRPIHAAQERRRARNGWAPYFFGVRVVCVRVVCVRAVCVHGCVRESARAPASACAPAVRYLAYVRERVCVRERACVRERVCVRECACESMRVRV